MPQDMPKVLKIMLAKSAGQYTYSTKSLPFWMHSLDTANILKKLAYRWIPHSIFNSISGLTETEIYRLVSFLGMVHDIGKLTAVFQAKICGSVEGQRVLYAKENINIPDKFINASRSPHSIAGEAILLSLDCPVGIAAVVGAHHGKPESFSDMSDENIEIYSENYFGPNNQNEAQWKSMWKWWVDYSLHYCQYDKITDLPMIDMSTQVLLTGLLIVGDWIASNTSFFPLVDVNENNFNNIYPKRVNDAWVELNFPDVWKPASANMSENDFKREFGFFPNDVQKEMMSIAESDNMPGLMILEAQMGIGKTEAALCAAEILASRNQSGGIFFGLPSQATANGLFPRIKNWSEYQSEYEQHTMKLMHGNAMLNKDYQSIERKGEDINGIAEDIQDTGIYLNGWFDGRKTGMLADFVIGTVDQFLMAALKRKHVMLRMLGLAGKVVIIDECHSYDAYMNQYLDMVLTWLGKYHTPVILLSATLPEKRRNEIVHAYLKCVEGKREIDVSGNSYPQITWTVDSQAFQKHIDITSEKQDIWIQRIRESELNNILSDTLSDGGCAAVIVNTVDKAQQIAKELSEVMTGYRVILFHSHYTMQDRADREKKLLEFVGKNSNSESRDKLIVVGTQVLEQSLDIDFDFMVTQLCPIDLFLQRLGRLHRHHKRDAFRPLKVQQAQCCILHPAESDYDKGSEIIYGDWLLHETLRVLNERKNSCIVLPDDIPTLIQNVYNKPDVMQLTPGDKLIWEEYSRNIDKEKRKAKTFCVNKPIKLNPDKPERSTIAGWLDASYNVMDDDSASAAVRDTEVSIEAIVVILENQEASFVPWSCSGRKLKLYEDLSYYDYCELLTQKVRLPRKLFYNYKEVLNELECIKSESFSHWCSDKKMENEYFLPLDKNRTVYLAGYVLRYDLDQGLICEKEGVE